MTTIYSKNDCVQCDATKRRFVANGITYNEINIIDLEPEALEELKAAGLLSAPVVVPENGEPWSGYQPDRIDALASSVR